MQNRMQKKYSRYVSKVRGRVYLKYREWSFNASLLTPLFNIHPKKNKEIKKIKIKQQQQQ